VGSSQYDLVIQLYNNAAETPQTTAQILTGLVFNISSGGPGSGLTLVTASAPDGLFNTDPATGAGLGSGGANICGPNGTYNTCSNTVSGGWEAAYSATGLTTGGTTWASSTNYGIGTSGLALFNEGNIGTSQYGIAPSIGISSATSELPYTDYYATLTLSGLTNADPVISGVIAAYGATPEGSPEGTSSPNGDTPEPATYITLLTGCLLLALARRWRLAN
jgi:hypothetical protein